MKYYFDNPANVERLREILASWKDTPWRYRTAVKGEGVDCIFFFLAVYEEQGIIRNKVLGVRPGKENIPWYDTDYALHNADTLLVDWVRNNLPCEEVLLDPKGMLLQRAVLSWIKEGAFKDGDLILYWMGKMIGHAGIYEGGKFWQCSPKFKVVACPPDDERWTKRMRHVFRVVER